MSIQSYERKRIRYYNVSLWRLTGNKIYSELTFSLTNLRHVSNLGTRAG